MNHGRAERETGPFPQGRPADTAEGLSSYPRSHWVLKGCKWGVTGSKSCFRKMALLPLGGG